ncbi:MAG: glycogen synthase [Lentisphaerae bacterium GWF2_45_14]|nr:MAG: glycogen synthase [Lentisphaerae bacterium GWF2_45_14]
MAKNSDHEKPLHIVMACSEAHPYAKTGGLADVAFSLPAALAKRGHKVSVFMPFYNQKMAPMKLRYASRYEMLPVPLGDRTEWAQVLEHKLDKNLSFYFIEFNLFFDRPGLYDWNGVEYHDNAKRFIFFSRACMEAIKVLQMEPDILHTHDWHTSLCNVYLKSHLYKDQPAFRKCKSALTIHNIGYQGVYHKSNLFWTQLGWDYFNFTCLEFHDQINLLKSGILNADMVNTVSPTYAEEILSPSYAFNLEGSLQNRAARGHLRGIINGIDVNIWNPERDSLISTHYSAVTLAGKSECKRALQQKFGLQQRPDVPLLGSLSRLAYQKGFDVYADSLEELLQTDDIQVIVIGSGEYYLQERLNSLCIRYPEKCKVYIGYCNDQLAHMLEAGSDFFVMPSRYEPCGLNQMYSMRYGTLPIVRATGGLEDTVINYEPEKPRECTGFKLWELYPHALTNTIRWAVSIYKNEPDNIDAMRRCAMKKDFSWNHTAKLYEALYNDAHRKF